MAPRQRNIPANTCREEQSFVEDSFSSSSSDDVSATSLSSVEEKKTSGKPQMGTTSTLPSTSKSLTLNITESDIARDNHDYFNLVALPFVIITGGINYEFPSGSYNGDYFWAMWVTTMIYFFLDLSWVVLIPICVKSPGVIIKHHFVAILYLFAPLYYPDYRWLMGTILSVELNTWFLICRRIVYRSYYCRSYRTVNPIITTAVSTLFYITWILIRCFLYPYVFIIFICMYKDAIESEGHYFFKETIFIFIHAALCVLNLKWTQDLFKPIVKRWFGTGPKSMVIQNGL